MSEKQLANMPKDKVHIEGLQIETIIGVFDWERVVKQTLELEIEFTVDVARAAKTDKLEDTLNYKNLCQQVVAFVKKNHFNLIETLAEQIAELIMDEFGVLWLRLRVSKPGALRGARNVGVVIERSRD